MMYDCILTLNMTVADKVYLRVKDMNELRDIVNKEHGGMSHIWSFEITRINNFYLSLSFPSDFKDSTIIISNTVIPFHLEVKGDMHHLTIKKSKGITVDIIGHIKIIDLIECDLRSLYVLVETEYMRINTSVIDHIVGYYVEDVSMSNSYILSYGLINKYFESILTKIEKRIGEDFLLKSSPNKHRHGTMPLPLNEFPNHTKILDYFIREII